MMLTPDETDEFIDKHFTKTAFRLEVLDRYWVDSDGGDVARYLAGEPAPEREIMQPWLNRLAEEKASGKLRHRVHVVRTPLSDYLRYECEWGYVQNSEAGEQIKVLDLSEVARPDGLLDEEFWLMDDQYVARMIYDADTKFIGSEIADDPEPYRRCRDVAEAAAEDFNTWWARHPEEWRQNR